MNNEQMEKSVEEKAADSMEGSEGSAGQPPPVKVPEAPQATSEIAVRAGLLEPVNLTEATRIAQGLLRSGCIPKQFDSVAKILMGMQVLRQLGLPDIACLPRLAIINGVYSLWGEGPKALCQDSISDFEEFLFDKDYNRICFANKNLNVEVYGAICRVRRISIPTWCERTFTLDDAKTAGLLGKKGPWQEYRPRMLQMRTRSWALKDTFPDRLMGVGIAEYDHHVIVDPNGDVPDSDQAPKLVERFK